METARSPHSFSAAWDTLLNLIYPPTCRRCGRALETHGDGNICSQCWSGVVLCLANLCPTCGAPRDGNVQGPHCPECPPAKERHFTKARFASLYEGPVRDLVHLLKFGYRDDLAVPLGRLLLEAFDCHFADDRIDTLIPVPLHRWRQFRREFNQSELLARNLCRDRQLELLTGNLIRHRPTRPQMRQTHDRRAHNVRGAFRLRNPLELEGRRVLVVDDIYTTGATVLECCRVLREQGRAEAVFVLTLTRALNPRP